MDRIIVKIYIVLPGNASCNLLKTAVGPRISLSELLLYSTHTESKWLDTDASTVQMVVCFQWCLVSASSYTTHSKWSRSRFTSYKYKSHQINISALKMSKQSNSEKNKQWIVAAQKKSCQHVCCVTSTEVEMVRLSWCVSGRVNLKSSYSFMTTNSKVEEWLLVAGDTSMQVMLYLLSKVYSCHQDKNTLLRSTGRQQDLTFISVQFGPRTAAAITNRCLRFSPLFLSRNACACSRSSGCRPPGRWRWGRCNPAWRKARWRKWQFHSSLLRRHPLKERMTGVRLRLIWQEWIYVIPCACVCMCVSYIWVGQGYLHWVWLSPLPPAPLALPFYSAAPSVGRVSGKLYHGYL